MSGLKRFWFGGSGALLPLLITLVGADLAVLIDQHDKLTQGVIIGAGIRYVSLFILGGFVASLHSDEKSPLKLVQLGIAAPALITSYISVAPANATVSHAFHMPAIIGTAHAADRAGKLEGRPEVIIVASGIFSDIYKGWSQPLNRAVKKSSDDAKKAKTAKKVAKAAAKKKAMKKSTPPAAKPSMGTVEQRKQALLEKRRQIELELKQLERMR